MTPTDINRRLALVIGYRPVDVAVCDDGNVLVWREIGDTHQLHWQVLDYRHPGTIYPIAEHYKIFPQWMVRMWAVVHADALYMFEACPRACVALAVIEAKERHLI